MPDRYFLDTNVLVYCFDSSARQKQRKAETLVQRALNDREGIISYQVVQEFLNVATRKFLTPMTESDAMLYVDNVLGVLCEVYPTIELYKDALGIQAETGFTFYDSLILASAAAGNCRRIYSEDLQSGRTVRGMLIQNPFAD